MPWQRQVADVALEVDPATGLLAYREMVLTVPRQSGKTLLELAVMVHRARSWQRQGIVYSAQTRHHARRKWEDEHVPALDRSPLAGSYRVRRQLGAEAIIWANGSMHGITGPTEKAGHGDTLDLVMLDEAWALEDNRVEQDLSPTTITRPQPQWWVTSTAGTAKSRYLRGKVDRGRARVAAGQSGQVAYFEWSADPDADPADPATWWSCMPALGRTVTEAATAAELERLDLPEFHRSSLAALRAAAAQPLTPPPRSPIVTGPLQTARRGPECLPRNAVIAELDADPARRLVAAFLLADPSGGAGAAGSRALRDRRTGHS